MKTLLKYDFIQLWKSKKILIFPIIFILFNSFSAISTKFLNQILASSLTDSGAVITLPDPTVYDSYSQYNSDLFQIILYIIIFISVGFFINDKTKGIAPLVFSKPIKVWQYLLSKYIAINALIIFSTLIGQVFFGYYTYIMFDDFILSASVISVLMFIVYNLFITAVAMVASAFSKNYVTGIVVTFLTYLVLTIIAVFKNVKAITWLPGSISGNVVSYITGASSPLIANCLIAIGLAIVLSYLSIRRLQTQTRF